MKELTEIFAALDRENSRAVLATLVKVEGSSYRRPGARLLVLGDGRRVGTITGGCLEAEICRRAGDVNPAAPPVIVTYEGLEDESPWGYGLGCRGVVTVMLERVTGSETYLQFIRECTDGRRAGVVATVFAADGDGAAVGTRVLVRGKQFRAEGPIAAALVPQVAAAARRVRRAGKSQVHLIEAGGTRAEVFVELVKPAVRLVVFGSDASAAPLVRVGNELGWKVLVCDRRAGPTRFPLADEVITAPAEDAGQWLAGDRRTAVVLMTHNYLQDLDVLRAVRPMRLGYLGVLGSRQRTRRLLAELEKDAPAGGNRVHGPIGLDVGAEMPEEIAVAVAAEVLAVMARRKGGKLSRREGPIHLRPQPEPAPAVGQPARRPAACEAGQ